MPRVLGQMLLISQHAMQQASGLFGARLARLWQEIHWGSLLTMAPVWALANARPQLLEQWQQRLVQGEPTLRVERELLGMRLLPICLALAERWRLPQWVIQGYRLLACDRRLPGSSPAYRPRPSVAPAPATATRCPALSPAG